MIFFCKLLLTLSVTDVPLAIDILKHKNIKSSVLFHCYDDYSVSAVHKIFNDHNIRIAGSKIISNGTYIVPKDHKKVGIVLDTACEGWTSVLTSKSVSFQDYSFIIITEHLSPTLDELSRYPIEVDSDVIVAHKENQSFNLYEVYNTAFKLNGKYVTRLVGHWNSSLYIKDLDRWDLGGAFVKTAVVIINPTRLTNQTVEQYMEKPVRMQVKVDTTHRLKFFILLKYMRDMYNFRFDMHRVNSWGYKRNGTFDGMVHALYCGQAELGGAPIYYRIDRWQLVQYVTEIWMSRHSFIFRHPKYPGGFYTIYTRPLSDIVWYCVIAMLVVTAIILWVMLVVQNNWGDNEDSSLSLAGIVIWGAICQQGAALNRESTSTKLLVFITFMYAVTLYQYYNATIVSSLLLEAPRNIRTLKDLLDSDLKAGAHDIVYNYDYFNRTTDPVAIALYHKKVVTATQHNYFSAEKSMELVKKGGYAIHIDTSVAFPLIKATFNEREICDTTLIQMYPMQRVAIVMRKNTQYREHVAYAFRRFSEVGLPQRLLLSVDEPMPECVQTPDTSVFCVGIREFSTPLLLLAIGMVVSIMLLVCEIVMHRVVKRTGFSDFMQK